MYHFTFALNCSIFNLMININIYLPLCWFLHFPLLYEGEGPRRAKNKIYIQKTYITIFCFWHRQCPLEMNWLWKTQNFGKDISRCYWVVKSSRPISHLSGGLLLLLLDLVLPPLLEVALMDDDPAEDDGVLHQGEEHQQHAGQQPHLHTQYSTVQKVVRRIPFNLATEIGAPDKSCRVCRFPKNVRGKQWRQCRYDD